MSSIRIAWSRQPSSETHALAEANMVDLVIACALETVAVAGIDALPSAVEQAEELVVTSARTIDVLVALGMESVLHGKHVYTAGVATARKAERSGAIVVGIAPTASDIKRQFGPGWQKPPLHLCGEHVAVDLEIPRFVVYRTRKTNPQFTDVEATALFSPRGVESVLEGSHAASLGRLLSIGPTTSGMIRGLGLIVYTEAPFPSELELLRSYLEQRS